MFWKKYKRLDQDISVINYQGIFHRRLTLFQGVALVVSGTVGAGVLSIPYAVSKVGLKIGILYIICLGFLMMGLNLLVGYITVRTSENFHLVGLAKKYLGRVGESMMAAIAYLMTFGALVIYTIGEGHILASVFGGSDFIWSLVFFFVFGTLVVIGMRSIKTVEFIISLLLLTVVFIIVYFNVPHIEVFNLNYNNLAHLLLPYGIVLFAFGGAGSIPEVHILLKHSNGSFKKAIVIAGLVVIGIYILFAFSVVGVTGAQTTEIATIGLGNKIGPTMFLFGNIFAFLAMAGSFLMRGLSLKDSMIWDYKMPKLAANCLVLSVPLVIFLLGIRQFIAAIDIVGGVFISLEMLMVILIYWKAKQVGDLPAGKFKLHHTLLLAILLIIVLSIGAVYSVVKLF
jgi:tyrosine-specific transport protein